MDPTMTDTKPTPEQARAAREWCQANPGPLLSYHYGEPNDDELDRLSADYEMQEASLARLLAEREAAVRGEQHRWTAEACRRLCASVPATTSGRSLSPRAPDHVRADCEDYCKYIRDAPPPGGPDDD